MKRLINCLSVLLVLSLFVSCQKEVSVEQSAPATGSLQNDFGDCLPKTLGGTYVAARALIDSNFIEVTVNVATPGAYTIATDTVNGYSFKATGVFSLTGATKVKLPGTGKPIIAGVNDFTVAFDTSVCFISIQVAPAGSTGGPASYTLQTSGSNCASTPSGTYVKDVTLTAGNTVSVGVNVTTVGTYSITTNTVNGYSFSGSGTFSVPGAQTVTLQGTGKPLAAGTDNFTTTAGTATCPFSITVLATPPPPVTNTDYFPTTLNSYWTYDLNGDATDTFKVLSSGPATFGTTTYQRFIYSDENGPFDSAYFRKDAATGFYYESIDTTGIGAVSGLVFSQPRIEFLFLKNTLTTNQTWNSDVNATTQGFPVVVRGKYTCLDAAATITINGRTFTNAYKVEEVLQVGVLGNFTDQGTPTTYYYVKGVGRIQTTDGTDADNIRFWQVN